MRSAASSVLGRGRHRFGTPGLIYVSAFAHVTYRGWFASWFSPGKHRHRRHRAVRSAPVPVAEPVPAV